MTVSVYPPQHPPTAPRHLQAATASSRSSARRRSRSATLRSTLWTLLITVAGMIIVTIISTNSVLHKSPDWYQGFDPTNQSLAGLLIGILTMGVFGVMVVTGEYSSGTIRTSLSATPRRPLFLAGKAIVAGAGMLVAAEALAFACFAVGQAILSGGGAPSAHLGQPGVARAVIMSGVFLALFGMLGIGLGDHRPQHRRRHLEPTSVLPFCCRSSSTRSPAIRRATRRSRLLANSVSETVVNPGQVSPTVGLLLMIAYAAAVLVVGAVMFVSRDA